MAKYPLGPLLSARKFREEAAERATRAARRAAEEAHRTAGEAKAEWQRYREWRPGEEARLFDKMRGQQLPLSALDRHREDVQALRAGEQERAEASRRADQAATAADGEVEKARVVQAAAARDTRKIDEHRQRWQREEAKRVEGVEEAELEDFPTRSLQADEDEAAGVEAETQEEAAYHE